MAWIILSIITCLALYFVLGFKGKVWQKNKKQWIALLGALWIAAGCIATVPTGHTGILVTFGAVEDATYEAGVHFKLPIQKVVIMDNRTQKALLELKCFSSDIQEVTVNYSINYQIEKENAQRIYKTIGTKYYEVVMEPRIHEAVRSVISKYSAENLIESRDQLSVKITEILEKELGAYNIVVVNTAIENLDFSDAFTNAVEEKQVAQQNYLKAQTEQEQKIMEQEASAERDEIAAKAAAEVAKIQADAAEYAGQRDAAINKALSDTLTEVLIKYYEIQRWDGKLPEYFVSGTDGVLPILGSLPTDGATE